MQNPFMHVGVGGAHGAVFDQVPVKSHTWGVEPLHCTFPAAHTPMHMPLTQVWFTQGTGTPQSSTPVQCWTALPEHCTSPAHPTTQ
jgi:hypothetical protein